MGLSKIGLAYHQIGRAREIIGIALKYGFGDFVTRSGFGKVDVDNPDEIRWIALRTTGREC